MKLKDKVKAAWANIRNKTKSNDADAELAADEVLREEIFPEKTRAARRSCGCKQDGCGTDKKLSGDKTADPCKKPCGCKTSKRSRPTNGDYRMIDRDDNTCDSSQS